MDNKFTQTYRPTIGADFMVKTVATDDFHGTMQIWDTAGQERFHVLSVSFFRGSDGCILVFDVNNAKSFSRLDYWHNELLTHVKPSNPEDFPFVLVGTKKDKEDSREVSRESIEQWCRSKGGIPYFETSARVASSGSEEAKEESKIIEDAFMCATRGCCQSNDNPDEEIDAEPKHGNKNDCIIS